MYVVLILQTDNYDNEDDWGENVGCIGDAEMNYINQ